MTNLGDRASGGGPGKVARAVRGFYEQHPYPPPAGDLDPYRQAWDNPQRRRAEVQLFWPAQSNRKIRRILVAGCGTSQAAKYALRWPDARITGIDFSLSSVKATETLKTKYDLDNLEVLELPVERAAELGSEFDLVVSTGVLHHLVDPDAGLSALGSCLRPDGAMYIMVYAPFGRAGIYMMQDYCRRLGIGASSGDIRDLAASLRALPQDHPLLPHVKNSPDFQSEAGLADALLHPQDRAYSVGEFLKFIDRAGLQFGRWIRQAPYLPHCGGLTQVPHGNLLTRLPEREQFAAIELFRGNMLRHSAIVYRSDFTYPAQPIGFAGTDWLDYVPIRVFGTISVEERLPASAAAVLINQAHTQTDIYLPINAAQKDMVERIDGTRTIGQIVPSFAERNEARTLFQRLWWYDQVVFDASASA